MCNALYVFLVLLGVAVVWFIGFAMGFSACEKKASIARMDKMIKDLKETK